MCVSVFYVAMIIFKIKYPPQMRLQTLHVIYVLYTM